MFNHVPCFTKITCVSNYITGVALHKPAENNGHGFVHIYRLMNGHGYHMPKDSNLSKWTWLMKEARLCYDAS